MLGFARSLVATFGVVGAVGVVAGVLILPAQADELTAQQIVDKTLDRNAFGFENAVAKLTLVIRSKRGSERVRAIEIRSTEAGGLGRTLVRFHAPADVAGTGFLILEKEEGDDDQYIYLPALGKVKRITGSQRNQKFMGTDLTYADMESRNLRKSTLKRLADKDIGGNSTYVIESTPDDPKDSQYGRTVSHIHKPSFVPLKVEFFDKKQKLLKTITVRRLEKKEGSWVAMDSVVKNVQASTQTQMVVEEISFSVKLSESEFTQRVLAGG